MQCCARGKILGQAMATYPIYHPKPLWSEQDPEDWWQATVKTVRAVVKKAKLKPADVRAIGLSGQMHGSVFLDKQNRVVRRALLWNDQRTAAECEEIEKRAGGRKQLIVRCQPAATGFTAKSSGCVTMNRGISRSSPKCCCRRTNAALSEFARSATPAGCYLDVVKRGRASFEARARQAFSEMP
jgi:glycerol kinase